MPPPENADAPLREQRGAEDIAGTGGLHGDHTLLARWRLLGKASCDPRMSRASVAVLWAICERVDAKTGTAWPGLGKIADDTGLNRSSVVRAVRDLVAFGLLERESGGPGTSNRYHLGRCDVAPRCEIAPRCNPAPQVGADLHPGVGADLHPEHASLNPHKNPPKRGRKKRTALSLPNWIDADLWASWRRHRGRKLTEEAERRGIEKLEILKAEGHDPRKLIELAIESGWASFYSKESTKANGTVGQIERDSRSDEEIAEANRQQLARFGIAA